MATAVGYRVVADTAMVVHFAFLVFVVLGGFLAWRWPWVVWPHLLAALWGFATIAFSLRCPLTDVEDWGRERAGQARLTGTGFIDHYLENVLYPERYTRLLQALAGVLVLGSWTWLAVRRHRAGERVRA